MLINKKFTKSHSNRNGAKIEYLVIHWVGGMGSARNNAVYFARENPSASAHYFVDAKSIWQSVPEGRSAWHCGGGLQDTGKSCGGATYHRKCKNSNSIGVELCCTRINGRVVVDPKAIARASSLVQDIMRRYKIPAERVIRHFDVTGKDCPHGYTNTTNWTKLKSALIGKGKSPSIIKWIRKRKVAVSKLRIRAGAGMDYRIVGHVYRGDKIQIYKISGNWGKVSRLRNRWLYLPYTEPRRG